MTTVLPLHAYTHRHHVLVERDSTTRNEHPDGEIVALPSGTPERSAMGAQTFFSVRQSRRSSLAVAMTALLCACGSDDTSATMPGPDQAGGSSGADASSNDSPDVGAPPAADADDETFARAVVAMNSCNIDDGFYRTTTYLRGRQGGYRYPDLSLPCFAGVTNGCDGVFECFGMELVPPSDPCGVCEGNVAILCDVGRWNCDVVGATCEAGRCVPPGTEVCDVSAFVSHCDDEGRPNDCDDVVHRGPVCSAFGLECVEEDSTNAFCRGLGEQCSGNDATNFDIDPLGLGCNGDALEACVVDRMGEIDCSRLGDGFGCQQAEGAFFCGRANECDPATFDKRCEGDEVVFCDAGKLMRVDCVSLGFTGCSDQYNIACDWSP